MVFITSLEICLLWCWKIFSDALDFFFESLWRCNISRTLNGKKTSFLPCISSIFSLLQANVNVNALCRMLEALHPCSPCRTKKIHTCSRYPVVSSRKVDSIRSWSQNTSSYVTFFKYPCTNEARPSFFLSWSFPATNNFISVFIHLHLLQRVHTVIPTVIYHLNEQSMSIPLQKGMKMFNHQS